jgi:hypothetical protein
MQAKTTKGFFDMALTPRSDNATMIEMSGEETVLTA